MASESVASAESSSPPTGVDAKPRKRKLHYELISCGLGGHVLAGTDAAELRPQDAVFAREDPGSQLRWYRCLRCDAWLGLPPPAAPARRFPPDRSEIELPLRGRTLRDKYVLRLIAVDRAIHFVILAILAVAVFAFLSHRTQLRSEFYRVVVALHGAVGGPTTSSHSTILEDLRRILALKRSVLFVLGFAVLAYALLEGVEAVGLWRRRRWAEYLTFIATAIL